MVAGALLAYKKACANLLLLRGFLRLCGSADELAVMPLLGAHSRGAEAGPPGSYEGRWARRCLRAKTDGELDAA